MDLDSYFIFDKKSYERVFELNKKQRVLYFYKKRFCTFEESSSISNYLIHYYFIKKNEKQLLTPQKNPFCIFLQNLFFSCVLNKKVSLKKFNKALKNKISNGKKICNDKMMNHIYQHTKDVFIPKET
ncbi:hypothetical protein GVAV_001696 [Gurleya vavrai]